jgi:hypothetical protein
MEGGEGGEEVDVVEYDGESKNRRNKSQKTREPQVLALPPQRLTQTALTITTTSLSPNTY